MGLLADESAGRKHRSSRDPDQLWGGVRERDGRYDNYVHYPQNTVPGDAARRPCKDADDRDCDRYQSQFGQSCRAGTCSMSDGSCTASYDTDWAAVVQAADVLPCGYAMGAGVGKLRADARALCSGRAGGAALIDHQAGTSCRYLQFHQVAPGCNPPGAVVAVSPGGTRLQPARGRGCSFTSGTRLQPARGRGCSFTRWHQVATRQGPWLQFHQVAPGCLRQGPWLKFHQVAPGCTRQVRYMRMRNSCPTSPLAPPLPTTRVRDHL